MCDRAGLGYQFAWINPNFSRKIDFNFNYGRYLFSIANKFGYKSNLDNRFMGSIEAPALILVFVCAFAHW